MKSPFLKIQDGDVDKYTIDDDDDDGDDDVDNNNKNNNNDDDSKDRIAEQVT